MMDTTNLNTINNSRTDIENLFLREMVINDALELLSESNAIADPLIDFDSISLMETSFDEEPVDIDDPTSIF